MKSAQKGGGFLDDIGLGDVLLNYYKGTNTISNQPIRYKGGKPLMKADHAPTRISCSSCCQNNTKCSTIL